MVNCTANIEFPLSKLFGALRWPKGFGYYIIEVGLVRRHKE